VCRCTSTGWPRPIEYLLLAGLVWFIYKGSFTHYPCQECKAWIDWEHLKISAGLYDCPRFMFLAWVSFDVYKAAKTHRIPSLCRSIFRKRALHVVADLRREWCYTATHCNTLQHTATHCSTLHHAITQCNTLRRTATCCGKLQHTATHCNTLQHTARCRDIWGDYH